jgi:scyllo-inositol 2-dehydrogenase (NADP+)
MSRKRRKPVGVGVIGYGKVGAGFHASYAHELSGLRLQAVCDTTEARREAAAQAYGCATYGRVEDLLADEEVHLVAIATPPNSHCDLAIAAAEAGKHIIVEKPFAMSYGEARKMARAAEESGVFLTANQNRRLDADYLTVRKAVEAGKLGEVYCFESRWSHFSPAWASWGVEEFMPDWRVKARYGGGMVYDYASHLGDQILRMVEAPLVSVFADLQSRIWSKEVDDHFRAFLRFANGQTALIEATNNVRTCLPRWFVIGDRATLISQPTGGCEVRLVTDRGAKELKPVNVDRKMIYENIRDVIRDGAEPIITTQHALEVMQLISAIFESANTGEVVRPKQPPRKA